MAGNDALSSVLGWMSLACWIVVYSPQLFENYKRKSGEGVSVAFVIIWLLGDLCNLVGALIAGLLPTVIIIAIYYSICDTTLLSQIYWYRYQNRSKTLSISPQLSQSEQRPLLAGASAPSNRDLPQAELRRSFLKYALAIVFVLGTGVCAWAIDERIHSGQDRSSPDAILEWRSQLIGWLSAVLFLGARVPQIYKNFETRCEGLAPGLFVFSISGNTTYTLSILAASLEPKYLITNASWLAGSALTVFLDVFVLLQFFYYRYYALTMQIVPSGGDASA